MCKIHTAHTYAQSACNISCTTDHVSSALYHLIVKYPNTPLPDMKTNWNGSEEI